MYRLIKDFLPLSRNFTNASHHRMTAFYKGRVEDAVELVITQINQEIKAAAIPGNEVSRRQPVCHQLRARSGEVGVFIAEIFNCLPYKQQARLLSGMLAQQGNFKDRHRRAHPGHGFKVGLNFPEATDPLAGEPVVRGDTNHHIFVPPPFITRLVINPQPGILLLHEGIRLGIDLKARYPRAKVHGAGKQHEDNQPPCPRNKCPVKSDAVIMSQNQHQVPP